MANERKDFPISDGTVLPVKIYRRIAGAHVPAYAEFIAKFRVFLQDRPGSLADFASLIAGCGGNISFFHYDRSLHSNRVVAEVQMSAKDAIDTLLQSLQENQYMPEESPSSRDDIQITSLDSVLEIKVRLKNEPGTLAAFANLLKYHGANVIYMLYDEDIDPEASDIALATKDLKEIDRLLNAVNKSGYYYRVLYRGADAREAEHMIGLKLVEKFFLKIRRLLPDREFDEIKSIVDSSQDLFADLVHFYEEAGNYLEAGDVFEKILTLASKSRTRVGARFTVAEMPLLKFGPDVTLHSFRLPTSENVYLFDSGEEVVMIDAGYGIYYQDIKKLMEAKSLDPSRLRRIYLTHPDADHAGTSGFFAEEYSSEVFMHPGSRDVIVHSNRAFGTTGRMANLNKYYTRLINKFTESRFPRKITFFSISDLGNEGAFRIIDTFRIGSLRFDVLESHGGHIPGHVFFLNREHGLIFTSDFLINVQSLSSEDKEVLSVYRYLLTNPNSDSQIFRNETNSLRELITNLGQNLKRSGRQMTIFPGHGHYYSADMLADALSQKK